VGGPIIFKPILSWVWDPLGGWAHSSQAADGWVGPKNTCELSTEKTWSNKI